MPCSTRPYLPVKVSSGAVTCPMASDLASPIGRAPTPPCVPWLRNHEEGSGTPHVLRLRIHPPYQEGSGAATRLAVQCGLRATNIKKSLAGSPVRLGSHVPNACTHVSKALDIIVIMGLQDVQIGNAFNDCKTCGHTTTVQHWPCCPRTMHRYSAR
jgi:hypothetical protein